MKGHLRLLKRRNLVEMMENTQIMGCSLFFRKANPVSVRNFEDDSELAQVLIRWTGWMLTV